MENDMDRTQNCAECEYIRVYDYGKRIYYCNHEDRTDDMGKIGVGDIPEESPKWCPLRCKIDDSSAAK